MGGRGEETDGNQCQRDAEAEKTQRRIARHEIQCCRDREPDQQAIAGARSRGEYDDGIRGMHVWVQRARVLSAQPKKRSASEPELAAGCSAAWKAGAAFR